MYMTLVGIGIHTETKGVLTFCLTVGINTVHSLMHSFAVSCHSVHKLQKNYKKIVMSKFYKNISIDTCLASSSVGFP